MINLLFDKKSLPVIIVLLFLTGCLPKDELTLPAKVNFEFEFVAHEEWTDLKSGPPVQIPAGRLSINRGNLLIEAIEFEGRRDEGKDVFFISNFTGPVKADLETGESNRQVTFDIPQGVYNRIEIDLYLGGDDEIPFVLEGTLRKGPFEEIPVRFEYNLREQIRVRAEPGGQTDRIVLKKDMPSTARVVVDAGFIFRLVNMAMLQDATITVYGDEDMVLINLSNNTGIFGLMATRLEKSFRIIFD